MSTDRHVDWATWQARDDARMRRALALRIGAWVVFLVTAAAIAVWRIFA